LTATVPPGFIKKALTEAQPEGGAAPVPAEPRKEPGMGLKPKSQSR
jgi:hypothetical protein